MQAAGFSAGPVFCRIDRWGHISAEAIAPGSVVPWLRDLFRAAGVGDPDTYSSHSLRRGFANWAKSSGWDVKELMEYVGWRDMNSALRYLERRGDDLSAKFEQGLQGTAPAGGVSPPPRPASRVAGTTAGSNIVQLPRRTP
jgi:hypothetical protein